MTELNQTPDDDPQALADAALAAAAPAAEADTAMDDWAAALAEQNEQPIASNATSAGVFQPLSKAAAASTHNDIEMILDIPVKMTVELGRTKIAIRNLLQLAQGSVVELDGLAGEPGSTALTSAPAGRGKPKAAASPAPTSCTSTPSGFADGLRAVAVCACICDCIWACSCARSFVARLIGIANVRLA